MNIRETQEVWEKNYLSPNAAFSCESEGREKEDEPCDIRPIYQRDRDRIIHSKSFRRMNHKTQVFLAPEGDHYRTRLTHTLEVSQTARTVARALRLNEDLTEAIAMGHDLGHTPFGHAGEAALNEISDYPFRHYDQSIRVVEILEKSGKGLNLTKEVKDGIQNHSTKNMPYTLEGKIVRLSDKFAYLNHDIDDAIRAGILTEAELPKEYVEVLGHSTRERLNTLIHDVVTNSHEVNDIVMTPSVLGAMTGLRGFMFERVYTNPRAKGQEKKAQDLLKTLYEYYMKHFNRLPQEFLHIAEQPGQNKDKVVCDYIAGMTDRYAVTVFQTIFVPKFWEV